MTSEQRYLVYNDMYMTESVSDLIQNIIERIKKFFREMHDRLTDHKVKKNVDTIKNDSELMNAEVEVPKGMKKVLNELLTKLKSLIKELTEPHQVAGQAGLALSYAAGAFLTKHFSEKERIKGSDLYQLYSDLDITLRKSGAAWGYEIAAKDRVRDMQLKASDAANKYSNRSRILENISDILTSLRNMQVIVVAALSAIASGRYIKNKIKKNNVNK